MKTKIIYVVTSSKDDFYLEQTLLSVYSLKNKNPLCHIELVVDRKTDLTLNGNRATILQYINKKVVVEVPNIYNKVQTSRYIKTSLRKYVEGDYLFIDSDTIVTDIIDCIDDFNGTMGAVLNIHVPLNQHDDMYQISKRIQLAGWNSRQEIPYYNSGVIYVRDNPVSHKFYQLWHEKWLNTLRSNNIHFDQPSFVVTNAELGFPIKEMDGVWNCQIMNNGLPFLCNAKVIHYFANHARRKAEKAYLFHDKDIYKRLRENDVIPSEISSMVQNAKGAFTTPCKIVVGNEMKLLSNNLYYLAMYHKKIYQMFDWLAKFLLNIVTLKNKILN